MPVVMLVAAAAVLIGVVVVALGRGGELSFFPADYAPLRIEQVSATDVALFRPPAAVWGYNMQATDEALSRIAEALTERDIQISALEQQVTDLERFAGAPAPRPPHGATLPSRTPRGAAPATERDPLAGEMPPAPDTGPSPAGSPWLPDPVRAATVPSSRSAYPPAAHPPAARTPAAPDDVLSRRAAHTASDAGLAPPARGDDGPAGASSGGGTSAGDDLADVSPAAAPPPVAVGDPSRDEPAPHDPRSRFGLPREDDDA